MLVENGVLIHGIITKDTVGNKAGALGHIVFLEQVSRQPFWKRLPYICDHIHLLLLIGS